ncbi:MAG: ABC transporter permease [Chloroflexi bacterium]|nr:ABC transporter permease [Chloroflexota bacterium]
MKSHGRIAALMSPPALSLALFFLLPMAIIALFSFRAGTFSPERDVFTLEHYQDYVGNTSFHRLLLQSAIVAFATSILSIIFAYPIAYFLAFRAGPARLTLLTILIVPAWTSYLLRILAWKLILGSNGLLNSLLLSTGLITEAAPVLLYSRTAVIVTLVYVWVPFVALPIFSALQRIDRHLFEAAADLGCPAWETFLRVTLPLSLPGVAAGFFFVFIPTLGEWVTPSLVGGVQGVMFGNLIQDQFVRALNWPLGSLMSLVMLALMLIQLALFSRFIRLSDLAGL